MNYRCVQAAEELGSCPSRLSPKEPGYRNFGQLLHEIVPIIRIFDRKLCLPEGRIQIEARPIQRHDRRSWRAQWPRRSGAGIGTGLVGAPKEAALRHSSLKRLLDRKHYPYIKVCILQTKYWRRLSLAFAWR